jgi:hypothetical protein
MASGEVLTSGQEKETHALSRMLERVVQSSGAVAREHAGLLLCGSGFVLLSGALLLVAGLWDMWVLRWHYRVYTLLWGLTSLVSVATFTLLDRSRYSLSVRRTMGAAVVFFAAPPFQSTFNSVKQALPHIVPFGWDTKFAAADRAVHGGRDAWELIRPLLLYPEVVRALDLAYAFWFIALLLFLVWSAWSIHPRLRMQALMTAMLVWVVCGIALAFVFSSAGPCYFSLVVPGESPYRYEQLLRMLDDHQLAGLPVLARFNQVALWEHHQSRIWLPFGGISAMPSVHVAMATLFAVVGWRRHPLAGMLLALYAVLIQAGSVALGWHYAIDGYVGALVTLALWVFVGRLKGIRQLPEVRVNDIAASGKRMRVRLRTPGVRAR